MASALTDAHSILAGILGPDAEPIDVLEIAEAHRQYWRPPEPRVILPAESHVYTTRSETAHRLRPAPDSPVDLPREFVRLVYCLGYGENRLLDAPIVAPRNSGTPQYWKIFQSCLTSPEQPIDFGSLQASRTPDAWQRLRAKLNVLRALRERGVWLLDASIAALYMPSQAQPSARVREAALNASYDNYIAPTIEAAAPRAILCIGIGVARALRTRLDRSGVSWAAVHQPQAHLAAIEHKRIHRTYGAICADPGAIEQVPPAV